MGNHNHNTNQHNMLNRLSTIKNCPISLCQTKADLMNEYRAKVQSLLDKSFQERAEMMQFTSLGQITPSPQVLVVFRMLFALIGDDNLVDFHLNSLPWVDIEHRSNNKNAKHSALYPSVKDYLLNHNDIESKLTEIMNNPEQTLTKMKVSKIKTFLVSHEHVFEWLEDNKNNFVYNSVVYYLAQIVKLTIRVLDHFVKTQGDLVKAVKNSVFVRIKQVRWCSYKKLMKKKRVSSKKIIKGKGALKDAIIKNKTLLRGFSN